MSWRLMILANGEIPAADHAAKAGQKMRGGAEARLPTIPSDSGKFGLFEELHGTDDPRVFAEDLEAAAKLYYGTAARAFLEYFIANWDEIIRQCAAFMEKFIKEHLPSDTAPEIRRILRRCAIAAAAGEKATEIGITGWPKGAARDSAVFAFKRVIERRGGVTGADKKNAVEQVRAFIASQHARFYPADPPAREITTDAGETIQIRERIDRVLNAAGYWKEIDKELIYLIYLDTFRNEVCRGFNYLTVAKELDRRKLLLLNERPRFTYRPTEDETFTHPSGVAGSRPRFFAVRAAIVDCEHS